MFRFLLPALLALAALPAVRPAEAATVGKISMTLELASEVFALGEISLYTLQTEPDGGTYWEEEYFEADISREENVYGLSGYASALSYGARARVEYSWVPAASGAGIEVTCSATYGFLCPADSFRLGVETLSGGARIYDIDGSERLYRFGTREGKAIRSESSISTAAVTVSCPTGASSSSSTGTTTCRSTS